MPWGTIRLTEGLGFKRIVELEWWESLQHNGWRVSLTPAKHWGARYINDIHRGYGGFIIEHQGRTIYHAGDTAYFEGFNEIHKRFKPEIALFRATSQGTDVSAASAANLGFGLCP